MVAADKVSRALRRRRPPAVAYSDPVALRAPARRTRLVRILVALALVGLLVGAVLTAGGDGRAQSDLVPGRTPSVLIVDLSRSIIDTELASVRATLNRLIATDTPTGLVVFSDVPYELLPAGSPASALAPVVRLFTPRKGVYPRNPWEATFRAGTRISTALELGHEMLTRGGVTRGSILLVSDLETAPSDYPKLAQTLTMLTRENVLVRAVPLHPTDRSAELFRSLLGDEYRRPIPSEDSPDATTVRRTLSGEVALPFLVVGGLLLLGLAANERWCTRLILPVPGTGEGR
jgi:hypothetical protein